MTFLYILLGIFVFGIIILIHELGHFMFAKLFKVGIEEFAIGMGPKLVSKIGKDGVRYSLRLIPMGGFVSMVGEDEDVDDERALSRKPVWQRMIIVAAGAFMNIVLGFVLMAVVIVFFKNIYSTTISGFAYYDDNGKLAYCEEKYGMQVGDTILKIGDRKINVREDFIYEVMFLADTPTDVTVKRDGEKVVIPDVVFDTYTESGITFGDAGYINTTRLEKTFPEVIKQSVCQSVSAIRMLWVSILNTFKGEYGTEALSGPVGVIDQVEQTVSYGWDAFLFLAVIITLNVGIVNLLPIPALDGGRLFFMLIELIRGKPINPKYEGYVHAAGFALLIGLMLFVTYNDIVRIFTR